MIGFLLKKTFYDFWDNMLRLAMLNFGLIILAAIPLLISRLFGSSALASVLLLVLGIALLCVYMAAVSLLVRRVSDYGSFTLADVGNAIRKAWPVGLILASIVVVLTLIAMASLPFYFSMGSLLGVFAGSMVFWILVVVLLALQFYLPVYARIDKSPLLIIKKCLMLCFDNLGLSISIALVNIAVLVLSLFAVFIFPGPASMLLLVDEAVRLSLLKYEYINANPGTNRRRIPWELILEDDRERTGTRSLRSIIFPWKD